MAARDCYSATYTCAKCGATGKVFYSENDYSFMSRLDREIDRTEGDVSAEMLDEHNARVTCGKCGYVIKGDA